MRYRMPIEAICEPPLTAETGVEPGLFRVEIHPSASCDSLVLAGEVNLEAADQVRDAALQALARGKQVAVDWSQAERVCAGALQVLLALRMALDSRGLVLSVAGDNPGVRHTLELAGLSHFFPVQERTG